MLTYIDLNKTKKDKIVLDKPGSYTAFFYNRSGVFTFDLNAKDIELNIYGLYVGKEEEVFKVETIQQHNAPRTTSNLLIKGVFDDRAKFFYKGLIRIEKRGQSSHAYQKNQNIVLSRDVFIESKPYLEILANDVFCTHGSTTGKINDDVVYYLQTRGIDLKHARNFVIQGFVNDILDQVEKHADVSSIRKNMLLNRV